MPRRKSEDNNIRKLTKSGNGSIGLTLPIEVVRELGWKEKQKVYPVVSPDVLLGW